MAAAPPAATAPWRRGRWRGGDGVFAGAGGQGGLGGQGGNGGGSTGGNGAL